MLRNKEALQGSKAPFYALLGGFAPEQLGGFTASKLGGHAPVHPLPTETAKDRKEYALFRKKLKADGFVMFQFSFYIRHCASIENADVHTKRVKSFLPPKGSVGIMRITDKQFSQIEIFLSAQTAPKIHEPVQLELF